MLWVQTRAIPVDHSLWFALGFKHVNLLVGDLVGNISRSDNIIKTIPVELHSFRDFLKTAVIVHIDLGN